MQTYEDDGWLRDLPFLAAACVMHGLMFSVLPSMRWGEVRPPTPALAVEFVTEVPKPPEPPTPALAPVPQAPGPVTERPAAKGGSRRRPKLSAAQRAVMAQRRAESRYRAKIAAAARAEASREKAERLAAVRLEREQRRAAERQAAVERAAAARAERARQRAEISQQLAVMVDPDENLSDAPNDPSLGPVAGGGGEAAALRYSGEAVYDVEREGYDPGEGKGSGGGGGGGGLSWSIEGPVGNRRIMRRTLPKSPAWVSQRGLELSVQVKFQVLPDGSVKTGAVINRTSGFPEVDRRAVDAILRWRFEAVSPRPGSPEIWGKVTFKFLMG